MERLSSVVGMVAIVLLVYARSYNRRRFPWRVVLWGTGFQLIFAVAILRLDVGKVTFEWIVDKITAFLGFTQLSNFKTDNSK